MKTLKKALAAVGLFLALFGLTAQAAGAYGLCPGEKQASKVVNTYTCTHSGKTWTSSSSGGDACSKGKSKLESAAQAKKGEKIEKTWTSFGATFPADHECGKSSSTKRDCSGTWYAYLDVRHFKWGFVKYDASKNPVHGWVYYKTETIPFGGQVSRSVTYKCQAI